jgi:hypothetical protein
MEGELSYSHQPNSTSIFQFISLTAILADLPVNLLFKIKEIFEPWLT